MSEIVIYGEDFALIGLTKHELSRLAAMEENEGFRIKEEGYNWEAVVYVMPDKKRQKTRQISDDPSGDKKL